MLPFTTKKGNDIGVWSQALMVRFIPLACPLAQRWFGLVGSCLILFSLHVQSNMCVRSRAVGPLRRKGRSQNRIPLSVCSV